MKKNSLIRFLVKCIAVTAAATGIIMVLNHYYVKVMDNPYMDADKFNYIGDTFNAIELSNLGSSHAEAAFKYDYLQDHDNYQTFNFAMSSQTFNYDYAILQNYQEDMAPGGILFIPVSYFSFNNEVTNEKERQSLSTKYYTFLSPRYIPDYSFYVDLVTARLPVLNAGEDILKIFPKLSLKAEAAELPTPEEFMDKADKRYERHMADKEIYFLPEREQELYDIIALCREIGVTPVLITTPFTKYYYELFSDEFLAEFNGIIDKVIEDTGVSYYDYSYDERFRGNLAYFSDADHLNDAGAQFFMSVIEQEVTEYREYLEAARAARAVF